MIFFVIFKNFPLFKNVFFFFSPLPLPPPPNSKDDQTFVKSLALVFVGSLFVAGSALALVIDSDDAVAQKFLGSPSVRIDGRDLEIEENEQTQYTMRCRIYRDCDEQSGVPSKDLIIQKLQEAQ